MTQFVAWGEDVSTEVNGNDNRVAGRDYQAGNTHLAVNIHGDNYGSISMGGGGSGGGGDDDDGRERHISQWSTAELYSTLVYYRSQWWSAVRGYWLNIPLLALLALFLGVAGSLFAGVLPLRNPQSLWMLMLPGMAAVVGLGIWLSSIRRIEQRVKDESQAAIDEIRTELRRRR